MVFFAAVPWTYWIALPLLVATVGVLLTFLLVYLKKVVEPRLLYLDEQRALALARSLSRPTAASTYRGDRAPGALGSTDRADRLTEGK